MKMRSILLSAILLTAITACIDGANILAVFPLPAKSHNMFIRSITDQLALRGHQLTIYTALPSGNKVNNIKEMTLNSSLNNLISGFDLKAIREMGDIPLFRPTGFIFLGLTIATGGLDDPAMKQLIASDAKYDLVLLQTHFGQEPLVAFGHKFGAPVVSLNTFSTYYAIDEFVGNPLGTAYLPSFELPYTDKMSFIQRVHNAVRTLIYASLMHFYYIPKQEQIMRQHFDYKGSDSLPPIGQMLQNVSLVVVNSQFSVDFPRPTVPNVISAGGAHISPNRKPLPQDLKEFMDNSKNGVIYLSFGSVVPSEQLTDDVKLAFVNAFRKLKQNVLWKIPVEPLPNLPKNIKISKWLPQHDILAHPNCLAFITHGGILSQEEAIYFAVPLIGVPFFADQYLNINRAVDRGFAIQLDQHNITEESVSWVINEILTRPTYRENAKKYSRIFRDNPLPPAENAAYWIEYVLRHKGAPHLRSEGRNLPYYKYLLLDVFAFLLLALITPIIITYKLLKFLFAKLFSRKSKGTQVASKKKKN